MNEFFGTQYTQEDLQRRVAQRRQSGKIQRVGQPQQQQQQPVSPVQGHDDGTGSMQQMEGGALDDIIMQNSREIRRLQNENYQLENQGQGPDRRLSMMEYGGGMGNMGALNYNPSVQAGNAQDPSRRHSTTEVNMGAFGGLQQNTSGNSGLPGSTQGYSIPLQSTNPLNMDSNNVFNGINSDMMDNMMDFGDVDMNGMTDGTDGMNMFSMQDFTNQYNPGNMASMGGNLNMDLDSMNPTGGTIPNMPSLLGSGQQESTMMETVPSTSTMSSVNVAPSVPKPIINPGLTNYSPATNASMGMSASNSTFGSNSPITSSGPAALTNAVTPPQPNKSDPRFTNIYSSSGFDMLGALMRVATRKNPEINIGAVDMSCAFVVCDITLDDCPIIYVSEIFERLTGYSKHEVLGRNCRFLQAPDGKVMQGTKRKYVDDESVHYLKTRITQKQEAQRSLINYRKGGQPFMNLLTMIPIAWDTDDIKYVIGFQVDVVEQPSSVAGRGSGGSYTVNYQQKMLPAYVWHPPESTRFPQEAGQTISRDEVSAVLSSYLKKNDSDFTKRMWDKVLLENTDDVIHVLSLKGLFLYLSPSSRQVLEYDPSELVGTALSSVCHPSDIVPVTRELKDTSAGASVNVVFRIRRKKSGYTWFESHGTLSVEQGKGRKCIILVGRERPVYALARHDLDTAGGIGDNELWSKLSTSGMFLFISSNVRILLDRQPEEIIGTSIQSIMRQESKLEFGRVLEKARTGRRVVFKHEVLNRRGQVLQAQTTLYPGDAAEGSKPTFLVGQTRLLKASSRSGVPSLVTQTSMRSNGSNDSLDTDSHMSLTLSSASIPSQQSPSHSDEQNVLTHSGAAALPIGSQDEALASEDNIFDELKTTRSTSWQFELRQMEKVNRILSEELASLLSNKKKRKRRKGSGNLQRDCANCHTRTTPEWRRGPSGQRDLCNSCGLRWAKQNGRVSPRNSSRASVSDASRHATSPVHGSPLHKEQTQTFHSTQAQSIAAASSQGPASTSPQPRSTGLTDIDEVSEP